MKKQLLSLKFALLAIALMCGIHVSAYDFYTGGIYYDIGTTGVTVENKGSFNTYSGNVTIPETVSYGGQTYNVIGIGYQAFKNCTGLTSVTLPNTVYMFLNEAFAGCTSLTTITLPASITAIYNNVFVGCTGLTSIYARRTEPRSANTNNFDAATYANATLFVPEEAYSAYQTTAPWSSFTNIKKTNFDFEVGGLYYHKTSDNTVEVTYKDTNYNSYSGGITIPKTITVDGKTYTVTAIGANAFRACSNLSDVSLNVNIQSIGSFAFWNCPKLTHIYNMPDALTTIEGHAFNLCSTLSSITIPKNVTSIGTAAFSGCTALKTIAIPDKVTSVGNNTFQGCTALQNLTIGTGLTEISYQMFDGCSALTSVVIPDKITLIKTFAFQYCTSLTEVTLGSGLTKLDTSPFKGCTALTKVTSLAPTPPTMDNNNCFDASAYSNATLLVPGASLNAYKAADWWRMFNTIESLPFDFCVNGIYYKKLTNNTVEVTYKELLVATYSGNVTIPANVTYGGTTYKVTAIGDAAFYMCTGLTNVSMPNTITSINSMAFEKCSGLTNVVIPSSVTSLGLDAFASCTGLRMVNIPNSVITIGGLAFYECTALTSVTIGSGVRTIKDKAFFGCTALSTVFCTGTTPPTMEAHTCFSPSTYNSAALCVPKSAINAYKTTDWWRMFVTILGMDSGNDPCDVNGDGEVNIADINALIKAILTQDDDSVYDANDDGEINIADINFVIKAILDQ